MRRIVQIAIGALVSAFFANDALAQPAVGMDFNRIDCNGNMHRLFANDLDSGNVVIIEFFMGGSCPPCITAANMLESMKSGLLLAHPGKIRSYAIDYSNLNSCTYIAPWAAAHCPTAAPLDSGETQVAYYGGFGMPTIVVLADTTHEVLFMHVGFASADTIVIKNKINSFFAGTLHVAGKNPGNTLNIFPNPAGDMLNVYMPVTETGQFSMQVTDVSGRQVISETGNYITNGAIQKTLDISQLPGGSYFLRVVLNGHISVSGFTVAR